MMRELALSGVLFALYLMNRANGRDRHPNVAEGIIIAGPLHTDLSLRLESRD